MNNPFLFSPASEPKNPSNSGSFHTPETDPKPFEPKFPLPASLSIPNAQKITSLLSSEHFKEVGFKFGATNPSLHTQFSPEDPNSNPSPLQRPFKPHNNRSQSKKTPGKNTTQNTGFSGFALPSTILATPKAPQPGFITSKLEPSSYDPTPQKQNSPDFLKNPPNFQESPIDFNAPSPFWVNSNLQTPNIGKHTTQFPQESPKISEEQQKKITETVFEDLLEVFFLSSAFVEFVAGIKSEKKENEVKFFINDVSKEEVRVIDDLKKQIQQKKTDLEDKKKINKTLSRKFEETEMEVKKILDVSESFRKKHLILESKIKQSSSKYSQILLPEFEEKERELHMLGGNRSNLSKILDRLREENIEHSKRFEDKKKDLSKKRKKNQKLFNEIDRFADLNETLRNEVQEIKPINNEVSLQCSWVNYKNERNAKRFKSYEDEIERVKREIKSTRELIGETKMGNKSQGKELDSLECLIKQRIEEAHSRMQQPSTKDTVTRPTLSKPASKSSQTSPESNDLKKLVLILMLVLLIVLIFT